MVVSAHPCSTLPPNTLQGDDSQGERENGHLSHPMKTVSYYLYSSISFIISKKSIRLTFYKTLSIYTSTQKPKTGFFQTTCE